MFRSAADVAHGRGTVIAGTGSNDTAHSRAAHAPRRRRRRRRDPGRDATTTAAERGLLAHFGAVAAATTLPVIVYNIPSRAV